jgi:hypothetical protein
MGFIKYSEGHIKHVVKEKTEDEEDKDLQDKLSSAMTGEGEIEKEAVTEDEDKAKKPNWIN